MSLDTRLVVVSCPRRAPIQQIWWDCFKRSWPDCPFPVTVLSPEIDLGWNANLITLLNTLSEQFVLLVLDDNFIEPSLDFEGLRCVILMMNELPDIALVKLQAGAAHAPELEFPDWDRIREYDRAHHPFKRTNLVPTLYRRTWLHRLSSAVLSEIGPARDVGRNGAIEFEMTGTLLTMNAENWPERMMGVHRPLPGGNGGDSFLTCLANDAVLEGRMRPIDVLQNLCVGVPGIEAFL